MTALPYDSGFLYDDGGLTYDTSIARPGLIVISDALRFRVRVADAAAEANSAEERALGSVADSPPITA